jgi:RNA-binding protein YhbY
MRTREVFVTKSDGQIVNKKAVREAWESTPPNGKFVMKIEDKNKRSLPQNAYYWACVVPLVKHGLREAGYDEIKTDEDAHEVMKHLFLKHQIGNKNTGEIIELTRSTTTLTKELFNQYLEDVWKWAAEFLGISIPSPGQQSEMFT